MQSTLIKAAVLFALVKFVPNQYVKGMALGVGGVLLASYAPYFNGKNLKGEAI